MKLNKTIISIVLLFLGIAMLTPLAVGMKFKQQLQTLIAQANQDLKQYNIKLEILNYQTGWFNSNAKIAIKPAQNSTSNNNQIELNTNITHGPIVYNNSKKKYTLALGATDTKIFSKTTGSYLDKIQIQSIYTFDNNIEQEILINPINQQNPYLSIQYNGAKILNNILFSGHNRIYFTDAEFGKLNVIDNMLSSSSIDISTSTFNNQLKYAGANNWNNDQTLNINSIKLNLFKSFNIAIDKLYIHSSTTAASQDRGRSSGKLSISQISINSLKPTRVIELNQVNNLGVDYDFITDFDVNKRIIASTDIKTSIKILSEELKQLNIIFDSNLGSFTFTANNKSTNKNINIVINISIAEKLAKYAYNTMNKKSTQEETSHKNGLEELIEKNYLIQKGNQYLSSITLKEDGATINGQFVSYDEFLNDHSSQNKPESSLPNTQMTPINSQQTFN